MSKKTSLYRHWNADGELLYVGISLSALHRLSQHKRDAKWFDEIAEVTIEHFETRELALDAERLAIQTEFPAHNVKHSRAANDNIEPLPLGRDETSGIYIVRDIETKEFHGILWAAKKSDLWDTFDEFGDPYGYEFARLASCGGLIHPRQGIKIKQLADADEDEDFEGPEWQIDWKEFHESESFSHALRYMDHLEWEPFCSADEDYGLIARLPLAA